MSDADDYGSGRNWAEEAEENRRNEVRPHGIRGVKRVKVPGKLDLATLLRVKRWMREAPGSEHKSFYWVLDKIDKAIKKEKELEK